MNFMQKQVSCRSSFQRIVSVLIANSNKGSFYTLIDFQFHTTFHILIQDLCDSLETVFRYRLAAANKWRMVAFFADNREEGEEAEESDTE